MRSVDRNEMPMARSQLSGDKEKGPAFLQAFQFGGQPEEVGSRNWVEVATAPSREQHRHHIGGASEVDAENKPRLEDLVLR
jgi:hypothetical protein